MNKKFTLERFVKTILVLSVLNIILVASLSFLVFQFLNIAKKNDAVINKSVNNVKEKKAAGFPVQSPVELPKVLYNLSGKITKLEKNAVIFSATIFSKDSNNEIVTGVESRKAIIDSSAKISRLSFVNNSPVEARVSFKDLKIGDYVEIVSDRDISGAQEFFATQVRILP